MGLLSFAFLAGCGGAPPAQVQTVDSSVVNVPTWFTPPQDPDYLYASATEVSKDMQTAIDKAELLARGDLSQQIGTKIEDLGKLFREEVGEEYISTYTAATKGISAELIRGARTAQQEVRKEDIRFRAYVLMELPIGPLNAAFMEKIQENQNMYARFRSSQTFKELADEVEKYEQWKKEQGQ